MRKRNAIILGVLFMTSLIISCKKDFDHSTFNAKGIEDLYKKNIKSSLESKCQNLTSVGAEKIKKLQASLVYDQLRVKHYLDRKILLVPVNQEFDILKKLEKKGCFYLLVYLDETNNVIQQNVVKLILNKDRDLEINHDSSFKAIINLLETNHSSLDLSLFVLDIFGKYSFNLNFHEGKISSTGTLIKKKKDAVNGAFTANTSSTTCVDWWHVRYYYDESGNFMYKEEEYLYTTCSSCGQMTPWGQIEECDFIDDGSIGGGSIDETFYMEAMPTSEAIGSSEIESSANQRTEVYSWTFAKNPGGFWKYNSIETGVHKKVNGTWRWESLTHTSVARTGVVVGGSLDCVVNATVPTVGIYNAGMKLLFTINSHFIAKGVPLFVSTSGTQNSPIWNVND